MFFYQDCGIFQSDFIVSIGNSLEECVLKARKAGTSSYFIGMLKEFPSAFDKPKNDDQTAALIFEDKADRVVALVIPIQFDGFSWEFTDTILHEIVHVVQTLRRAKGFKDDETEAYLTEYLFKEIRKKIMRLWHGRGF